MPTPTPTPMPTPMPRRRSAAARPGCSAPLLGQRAARLRRGARRAGVDLARRAAVACALLARRLP